LLRYYRVMTGRLDLAELPVLRRRLLGWYRRKRRAMPWRVDPGRLADPYGVFVSETMLQQTQVSTVIGYFDRFLDAMPNVNALAAASEQQVLRLWQGLGYYRRARLLHLASQQIVREHAGKIPQTVPELLKLPGVGRYTAGAIASIAYGRPAPVVDGNVARVLCRLAGRRRAADDPRVEAWLWELMGSLVKVRGKWHAGDVNQAVMELGATVCTPTSPRCGDCPWQQMCRAKATGQAQILGRKSARRAPRSVVHTIVAIERGGRYLFEQRHGEGLWSGLWQLPTWERADESRMALADRVRGRTGLDPGQILQRGQFIHQTTHRRIRFTLYVASQARGRLRRGAGVWRRLEAIDDLPISNAQRRALALLAGQKVIDPRPRPEDTSG
jgi:A/G-specific adenine glycosylase